MSGLTARFATKRQLSLLTTSSFDTKRSFRKSKCFEAARRMLECVRLFSARLASVPVCVCVCVLLLLLLQGIYE